MKMPGMRVADKRRGCAICSLPLSQGRTMSRLLLLILLLPAFACAAPDRASLIQAWEAAMRSDGTLDAQPGGDYRYRNESLGYDGGLKITSAIVRAESVADSDRSAMGTVDFDLSDMPAARGDSPPSGLASWKAERQSFIYDSGKQSWQTVLEWSRSRYRADGGISLTATRWVFEYALPVGLLALVVAVFLWLARVQRQAKRQLVAAADVNRLSRENIERAAKLQEEQRARMHESLELARHNTATLDAILEELRRRA
jgi:hypothetical protein